MSALPIAHVFPEVRALTRNGVLPAELINTLSSDDRYQLPAEARQFSETFTGKVTAPVLMGLTDPVQSVLWQLLTSKEKGKDLSRVAGQVDAVLRSPRLRDRLMERATMIGGGSPDDALDELRTLFEATLGNVLEKVSGDEPLLHAVAARRREVLIEKLEAI